MNCKYGTYGGEEIRYVTIYHYEDRNGIDSKIFIRRNTCTLSTEFQFFVTQLNSPSYNSFYEMMYFDNNFANFPPNTQNCIFFYFKTAKPILFRNQNTVLPLPTFKCFKMCGQNDILYLASKFLLIKSGQPVFVCK